MPFRLLIDDLPALCIHLDKPTEKKTFDPSRKKKASGSKAPPPDNKTDPAAEVKPGETKQT